MNGGLYNCLVVFPSQIKDGRKNLVGTQLIAKGAGEASCHTLVAAPLKEFR